ncbi:peptide-binding protein [Planctomicrobium sp. SH668]|uniref:peptide-binding protein n=1 Tax=Planctomicrobium sp. SH668 TaxID=3448126 RepID=UPI003F5B7E88
MTQNRSFNRFLSACFLSASLLFITGCPSSSAPSTDSSPDQQESSGEAAGKEKPAATEGSTAETEVLLEPFTPPSLDELNSATTWEAQPVLDATALLKKHFAENPPEMSLDEALKASNTNPEMNRKILSALGQPPSSPEEVDYEARASRHFSGELGSTNPLMMSSVVDFDYHSLTGFGLFSFDWNLIPFGAAEAIVSWDSSKDKLYDKVVLRDDLTWSDGTPITAHDIAFTFQAIMNPKVPVRAVRSSTSELKWVHAYDDRTVVFFHKKSLATNSENISFPILPKHIYEKAIAEDPTLRTSAANVAMESNPVVGGPYKLVKRVRGSEILLERRDDWFMHNGQQVRDKPYLKEIRFRIIEDPNTALLALKSGEIEELRLRPEQWMTQTGGADFTNRNVKVHGREWTYFYFGWNMSKSVPFFQDQRVREAMSYAFDHNEFLQNICYGLYEPGQGIFHPTAWMAPKPTPTPYTQNLDKAEDLLDAAGWEDSDGDGYRDRKINGKVQKFEFTVVVAAGSETGLKACELLKSNLDQIGIVCHIKPVEYVVMQDLTQKHQYDAMFGGWGTGTDPSTNKNLWTTRAIRENGRNYGEYSNSKVDELFEKGEVTFDRDERAKIYAEIAAELWKDQPYTWLFYQQGFYGFSKNWRGYMFSPRNPFGYSPGFMSVWIPKSK